MAFPDLPKTVPLPQSVRSLHLKSGERWLLPVVVALAFALRLVALLVLHRWPTPANPDFWKSGMEIVNIAASLAGGHGFASPFAVPTGATAWIPPAYPAFIAVIFILFGVKSLASAIVILIWQSAFSALACIPIHHIANQVLGQRIAFWSTVAWAFFPYSVLIPVLFLWDTALSALLFACITAMTLYLASNDHRSTWLWFGALWALAAYTNPSLLALLPFALAWLWYQRARIRLNFLRPALLTILVLAACMLPWTVRNWRALGTLVPMRSNFGEELWIGNHPGGAGRIVYGIHPSQNPAELKVYERLGEIGYVRYKQAAALDFIRSRPLTFVYLVGFRTLYWWFAVGDYAPVFLFYAAIGLLTLPGLVLLFRSARPGSSLIALMILAYPLVYYFTDVFARYRYPVEPAMYIASVYAVGATTEWLHRRQRPVSAKATM